MRAGSILSQEVTERMQQLSDESIFLSENRERHVMDGFESTTRERILIKIKNDLDSAFPELLMELDSTGALESVNIFQRRRRPPRAAARILSHH